MLTTFTSGGFALVALLTLSACGGSDPAPEALSPEDSDTPTAETSTTATPATTKPTTAPAPGIEPDVPFAERGSVRLANMVTDVIDLGLCVDGMAVLPADNSYGTVSIHAPSGDGTPRVGLTVDDSCDDPLFEDSLSVGRGVPTTVLAVGSFDEGTAALFAITDDFTTPPAGFVRVRGFHGDPEAGALDLGRILEDGGVLKAMRGLTFGTLATDTDAATIDPSTGYVTMLPVPTGSHFGAFRSGTDHQIVDIVGPDFTADRVYAVYPIGAVISGEPPAEVMVCDDTQSSEQVAAACDVFAATVVGDPLFAG